MTEMFQSQKKSERQALIEISKGSWLLDTPEIQALKSECHGKAWQLTDFCEFGLRDPENHLPHLRSVALIANFPLQRSVKRCSGHNGKAHQWTKGQLSQRFGGVSRLGYSQRWTPQFSRDVLEDFVDHLNPLKRRNPQGSPGIHQSQKIHDPRSNHGCQRKVGQALEAMVGVCARCQAEREHRPLKSCPPHRRNEPDCKFHGMPISSRDSISIKFPMSIKVKTAEGMKRVPQRGDERFPAAARSSESGPEARQRLLGLPERRHRLRAKAPTGGLNPPAGASSSSSSSSALPPPQPEGVEMDPDRIPGVAQRYPRAPEGREPTRMEAVSMQERAIDRALLNEVLTWCGEILPGHTKFLNIHNDCGTDAEKGPEELIRIL